MVDEVSESKRAAKTAIRKSRVSSTLAATRLSKLKDHKAQVGEVKDKLAEEAQLHNNLEKLCTSFQEIKKERIISRSGGQYRWPLHVVMFVWGLLSNGAPPAQVRSIL